MTHPGFSALLLIHGDEHPAYVEECLQALVAQSWQPARVVVVSMGLPPPELEAVFSQGDPTLPLTRLAVDPHVSEGAALAAGFDACEDEFVAHVDPHSVSQPWRFERQVGFLQQNLQFHICGSALWEVEPDTLQTITRRAVPETDAAVAAMLPYRNPFNHQTVVLRRDAALACGGYGGLPYAEDYFLWLRMLAGDGKGWNLQDELVLSRRGTGLLHRAHGSQHVPTEYRLYRAKRRLHLHHAVGAAAVFVVRLVSQLPPASWFARAGRRRRRSRQ
ncbi:glycosyltransferase [Achromobacter sp. GG226]|uniref:glycosyltransferase n=1 Tax=Verticiella alkaliphila TaxID=2779529 RepID=UPI001C0B4727|nr:glycosyltransferase [Verticiella sp. GG226]MBU4609929.1 glycosyltransferase [Verticiella sp. GG226]